MTKVTVTENRFEKGLAALKRRVRPVLNVVSALIIIGLVVEGMSFAVLSLYGWFGGDQANRAAANNPRQEIDVYADSDWAEKYFEEWADSGRTEYFPYVGYRRVPNFAGDFINLDDEGRRRTVPDCGRSADNTTRIFMFGGSAVWGTGARDEGTIPSFLARNLCESGIPVTVTNFGESGYTNTQELFRLQLELQRGRVPEIVVFYDGVNDVFSSYQNQEAGLPQNVAIQHTAYRVTRRPLFVAQLIGLGLATNTGQLALKFVKPLLERAESRVPGTSRGASAAELDKATVEVLRRNRQIVAGLEREFGFRSFFYWQPALYTKNELSPDEVNKIQRDEVFGEMYMRVSEMVDSENFIKDLSDVLDEYSRTFFIDEFHISEEGNKIIADLIASDIAHYLSSGDTAMWVER